MKAYPPLWQNYERKKQPEKQRQQALHAVTLYFGLVSQSSGKTERNYSKGQNLSKKTPPYSKKVPSYQDNKGERDLVLQTHELEVVDKEVPKSSGADWTELYDNLKNTIKVRHYSPSTLKSYLSWIRKLQTYTKSKDYHLLEVDDVKGN